MLLIQKSPLKCAPCHLLHLKRTSHCELRNVLFLVKSPLLQIFWFSVCPPSWDTISFMYYFFSVLCLINVECKGLIWGLPGVLLWSCGLKCHKNFQTKQNNKTEQGIISSMKTGSRILSYILHVKYTRLYPSKYFLGISFLRTTLLTCLHFIMISSSVSS